MIFWPRFIALFLAAALAFAVPLHAQEEEEAPAAEEKAAEPAKPEIEKIEKQELPKPEGEKLVLQKPVTPPKLETKQHFDDYSTAVLQDLDKMNARVQTLDVAVGKPFQFGPLEVVVKACRKTPPEDLPEAAAYVEVRDTRYQNKDMEVLFRGWMFASSPALSALEHPNYDVWVLDCKNASAKERSAVKPASSPKKASPDKAAPKAE